MKSLNEAKQQIKDGADSEKEQESPNRSQVRCRERGKAELRQGEKNGKRKDLGRFSEHFLPYKDTLGKEQEEQLGRAPHFPSTHHLRSPSHPSAAPRLHLRPRTPRQSQTMASALY